MFQFFKLNSTPDARRELSGPGTGKRRAYLSSVSILTLALFAGVMIPNHPAFAQTFGGAGGGVGGGAGGAVNQRGGNATGPGAGGGGTGATGPGETYIPYGGGGAANGASSGGDGGVSGQSYGVGGNPGIGGASGVSGSPNGGGGGGGGGGGVGTYSGFGFISATGGAGGAGGKGGDAYTGGVSGSGGGGGAGGTGLIGSGNFLVDTTTGSTSYKGGVGGAGGNSGLGTGGQPGAGGDGGIGAIVLGAYTLTNNGTLTGGAGGAGGSGGNGGAGVLLGATGAKLINNGTVQGGASGGTGGLDGAGVQGAGVTIVNSGKITGGGSAASINFTGGANTLSSAIGQSLGGPVAIGTGSLTLDQTGANGVATNASVSYGVGFTGAGSLTVNGGSNTVTLGVANTYSGGTTVNSGTIGVGNNSALGTGALSLFGGTTLQFVSSGLNIANAIVLLGAVDPTVDTGANTDTLSGVITGSANLTKIGSGALTLTGSSPAFTGSTEVAAGALAVNGSIAASAVQVDSGATLGGSGTVGSINALGGSTVAPGVFAPYSTLTAAGPVTFGGGSTFLVNVNAAGQNDKLVTTGAATLGGAAVQVQAATGTYTPTTKYTLLTAQGGVSGTFGSLGFSSNLAFLAPALSYDANDVYLGFANKPATFASVAQTPNQIATANALQAQPAGSTLSNAIIGQTAPGARAAFDALSGEIHASAVSNAFNDSRLPREAVLDRLSDPFGAAPSSSAGFIASAAPVVDPLSGNVLTTWGQAFGSSGHTAGDGNAASFNSTLGGFIFGADESIDSHYRLGVAGGYTQSSLSAAARGSAGDVYSTFGGLYGSASFNALQLRAGALYAYNRFETNRMAVFPGFAGNLDSAYGGNTTQGFVEAGWRIPVNGFFPRPSYIEPFAGGAVVAIDSASFAETGGAAALNGQSSTYDYGATTLGLRGEAGLTDSLPLVARGLLAWRHVFGDVTPNSVLAFASAPSNLFTISGAPVSRDAAMIEAGLDWRLSAQVSLGVYYSGALSSQGSENAIKGRIEARF